MHVFTFLRMVRTASALTCAVALAVAPGSTSADALAVPPGWIAAELLAPAPASVGAGKAPWFPPLGEPLRVLSHYSLPNGPFQAGHRGIDLPAAIGDAVRAPVAGVVAFSGVVAEKPVVTLRVDAHTVVSFEPVVGEVEVGTTVGRGETLGFVGTGGHCANACLHVGVRVNDEYVNPMRAFRMKPVLLPWEG